MGSVNVLLLDYWKPLFVIIELLLLAVTVELKHYERKSVEVGVFFEGGWVNFV